MTHVARGCTLTPAPPNKGGRATLGTSPAVAPRDSSMRLTAYLRTPRADAGIASPCPKDKGNDDE